METVSQLGVLLMDGRLAEAGNAKADLSSFSLVAAFLKCRKLINCIPRGLWE